MTGCADGKIEAYLGPTELGGPDDLETVIIEFIQGAKRSLDIAVQELDNPRIAQAILDARWRGIDVDLELARAVPAQHRLREEARVLRHVAGRQKAVFHVASAQ